MLPRDGSPGQTKPSRNEARHSLIQRAGHDSRSTRKFREQAWWQGRWAIVLAEALLRDVMSWLPCA
jgi:hypothetical protein